MREQIDLSGDEIKITTVGLILYNRYAVLKPAYPAYEHFKSDGSYFKRVGKLIVNTKPIHFKKNDSIVAVTFDHLFLDNEFNTLHSTHKVGITHIESGEGVVIEPKGIILHVI